MYSFPGFPRFIDQLISVREFYSPPCQGYNVNFSRHVARPLRMHDDGARDGTVADYYHDYHNYDNYVASASVIKRRLARGARMHIKVIPISPASRPR